MFASSRPTALRFTQQLGIAVVACLATFGFSATAALAATPAPAGTATCPNQTFAQVFAASGDLNYYTLVPGGEFNSIFEGWLLENGARIVGQTRPNGSSGGVLDLPSGAMAISAPLCVTLQYPTARTWVRDVKGSEGVNVAISYAGTRLTALIPQNIGQVNGAQTAWTPSNPVNIQPQLAGTAEGTREARFVFANPARNSEVQLYGLYVDPRMR